MKSENRCEKSYEATMSALALIPNAICGSKIRKLGRTLAAPIEKLFQSTCGMTRSRNEISSKIAHAAKLALRASEKIEKFSRTGQKGKWSEKIRE
jgi:hypothetical protein